MHGGIKNSCDVYFYEMPAASASTASRRWLSASASGAQLGIDMPNELPGLIPTATGRFGRFGIPWQPGETISCGIGQGYITRAASARDPGLPSRQPIAPSCAP